jgi:hypothetical protein
VIAEWEQMLRHVYQAPRPVPFSSSTSSLPSSAPWEEESVHPDIFSDLRSIYTAAAGGSQSHCDGSSSRLCEVVSFALSIPFNEAPLRLRDVLN